ncbi:MAG: thioredoxin domain-containing protein [Woeseiaceae bacterium]|nr:thioredoxin domain-containing protein [Woeseiaceae bacterium]
MPNRLATETSPYLKQHADNPVDWYPWGDEAFELARQEGKPVLLSVGYSACHWCHVMAHESFEDDGIAQLMNELYVNVKVDREERPDVDKIYQTAHQLITQRPGGWPLTMFLTAEDRRPFFGGTYFPKDARYGMPAFGELLQNVARYHDEQREEIDNQGARLLEVFDKLEPPVAPVGFELNREPVDGLVRALAQNFDRDYGGMGSAPKFPHPATLSGLLRRWRATANDAEPDLDALFMATLTMSRMADGGLFDHLGGGFCRYSVDRYWQIPHFEKMLYDNGPLLAAYVEAYLATGEIHFGEIAGQVADWMLTDMLAPNGGFYSTRDADSEGEEGRYYVWTPESVRELLEDRDYELFAARFGLEEPANFEGQWHLSVRRDIKTLAKDFGLTRSAVSESLDRSREALLAEREKRVAPGRDEKQLTSWNALAIRGLAIAGRALNRPDLVDAANDAVEFIRDALYVDGRLLASYKDGRARFDAYLDDYAFLADAVLELLQARWSTSNLAFAIALADTLLEQFEDRDRGGFYFTADDHETLIHRTRPMADEALPSGNGIAIFALQRLGFLLGETRYLDAAERGLKAAWSALSDYPHGHVTLLNALDEYTQHPEVIVIRGDKDEAERWSESASRLYAPARLVYAIPSGEQGLPGALNDRAARDGETLAYRCVGTHCELPVSTWEALAAAISGS